MKIKTFKRIFSIINVHLYKIKKKKRLEKFYKTREVKEDNNFDQ
jgi:hypothetical protein